jgi:hypothetical protein
LTASALDLVVALVSVSSFGMVMPALQNRIIDAAMALNAGIDGARSVSAR